MASRPVQIYTHANANLRCHLNAARSQFIRDNQEIIYSKTLAAKGVSDILAGAGNAEATPRNGKWWRWGSARAGSAAIILPNQTVINWHDMLNVWRKMDSGLTLGKKDTIMKRISTISALFLLPSLAFCCSCLYGTSFCELITPTKQIANVRIFNTHLDSLNLTLWLAVVVEEALQGSIEQDTMTILASQGTSCDPDFSEFQIGGNLIVQFDETITGGPTNWPYFIFGNICEESYLHLKDDMVIGFIREEYEMQPYQTFRNQLSDCANYTHIFDKEELEQFIHIFPVPAASEAFIDTQIPFDYTLTIFTATGQLLQQETVIGKYRHPLYISDLPSGLYFVRLQVGDVTILKRLLVQR